MNNGIENRALRAQAKNTSSFALFPTQMIFIEKEQNNRRTQESENIYEAIFGKRSHFIWLLKAINLYLQQLEKFIGCVMASYRSMLSATKTYVDAYVVMHCKNLMTLHATLPASHVTVNLHMISTRTLNKPTLKSRDKFQE